METVWWIVCCVLCYQLGYNDGRDEGVYQHRNKYSVCHLLENMLFGIVFFTLLIQILTGFA
jgi:hypothetical protein